MEEHLDFELERVGDIGNIAVYGYSRYSQEEALTQKGVSNAYEQVESYASKKIATLQTTEQSNYALIIDTEPGFFRSEEDVNDYFSYVKERLSETYFAHERHMTVKDTSAIHAQNIFSAALEDLERQNPTTDELNKFLAYPSTLGDNHPLWKEVTDFTLACGWELPPMMQDSCDNHFLYTGKVQTGRKLYGLTDVDLEASNIRKNMYGFIRSIRENTHYRDVAMPQNTETMLSLFKQYNGRSRDEEDMREAIETACAFEAKPRETLVRILQNEERIGEELKRAFGEEEK